MLVKSKNCQGSKNAHAQVEKFFPLEVSGGNFGGRSIDPIPLQQVKASLKGVKETITFLIK